MGLDITAYERVKLVKACSVKEANEEERDDVRLLYRSFEPQTDGMVDGYYEIGGETFHFRGGSYSGYSLFREQLAALVGMTPKAVWKNPKPGPFVDLINFSDCEGFIGPKTSARLAGDFVEWAVRAEAVKDYWFPTTYANFSKAFAIAAKGGAVKFS